MIKSHFSPRIILILASALMLILASTACGAGSSLEPSEAGVAPAPTFSLPVAAATFQPTQIAVAPAILETRRLTLEFPSKMRAGVEGDIIRLKLEVDDLGNITPTAQIEGNVVVGEMIEIPDLYETHNVTAEA